MEKTPKQEKEWQEFKDDLLGSMDLEYSELVKMMNIKINSKTKYLETKDMNKFLKKIRNIIHSHKILRRNNG